MPPEQLPKNFDTTFADEVIALNTADAKKAALELVAEEEIFAGTSSRAALWAATQLAGRSEDAGKIIVAIFPGIGERYFGSGNQREIGADVAFEQSGGVGQVNGVYDIGHAVFQT